MGSNFLEVPTLEQETHLRKWGVLKRASQEVHQITGSTTRLKSDIQSIQTMLSTASNNSVRITNKSSLRSARFSGISRASSADSMPDVQMRITKSSSLPSG